MKAQKVQHQFDLLSHCRDFVNLFRDFLNSGKNNLKFFSLIKFIDKKTRFNPNASTNGNGGNSVLVRF
jgi:hypothetical protein